jgi:hypothetical protein
MHANAFDHPGVVADAHDIAGRIQLRSVDLPGLRRSVARPRRCHLSGHHSTDLGTCGANGEGTLHNLLAQPG